MTLELTGIRICLSAILVCDKVSRCQRIGGKINLHHFAELNRIWVPVRVQRVVSTSWRCDNSEKHGCYYGVWLTHVGSFSYCANLFTDAINSSISGQSSGNRITRATGFSPDKRCSLISRSVIDHHQGDALADHVVQVGPFSVQIAAHDRRVVMP